MAVETIRIEIPIESIDKTDPALSNVTKRLGQMGKAEEEAGVSADRARKKVTQFDRSAEKTQKSLSKWVKEKYEVLLEAKERITPVLQTLGRGIRNLSGKTWHVTMRAVDMVTSPVKGIIKLLKNPIFQAGAILGVTIGLNDTVDTYKDFESAMSQVSSVSGATGADLEALTEKAKEMGSSTKFTATETAEGFNYMAMAGWKTKDMLDGIEGLMSLAAASGEDLATTSDIVTDALSAFNMKAKDAKHFSDVLAAAASNANTTVSGMGETFKYAGSMAGTLGYSIEDVALMTGLMANSGIKSSMSGTALNSIFTRLSTDAGATSQSLGALGTLTEKLGIDFFDSSGNARDLSDVMAELRVATRNMNDEEKSAIANKIAGTQAQKGLLAILNASEDDYNKLADAINNADGAAADMSETMLDNLEGSITLFQSALDGVKMSLGERLSPYVRSIADWLTDEMPEVDKALSSIMDSVDMKISRMKRRFSELTSSEEWKNADFLGKMKLSWDEFIAQPFGEWWESTGRASIIGKMGDIGRGLGSAINSGIMTLLGFDVSDTLNEGENIGASFAKGFAEGFDFNEISRKLWEGLKNIVANAAKLLPGGEEADLSSLLSAGLLFKMASPLVSAGSTAVNIGKMFKGTGLASSAGSLLSKAAGSFTLDAELAGVGNAAGTGLAGMLGNAGVAMGATTSTGAVALGAGTVAGGIAGAAGLIHGGMDLYEGFMSDDKARAAAYKKAGAIEVGGTLAGAGAGAAAGAAIGAVFGGVGAVPGALIGAGVGAIGSYFAGEKVKGDYEEDAQAAAEAAENARKVYQVTGIAMDKVTFKTKALKKAMDDSTVSADEFAAMYQEAVSKNLDKHFGDVALSLEDVQAAADDIVFAKHTEKMEAYSKAADKAASTLSSLKSSMASLERLNWKAGVNQKTGIAMTETEVSSYKAAVDSYRENAKQYIEDQHFEATAAVELVVGKKKSSDIVDSLDKMYGDMEKSLSRLSKRLSKKVSKALEDGIIDADEQNAITKLQDKIQKISEKVSSAQEKASLNALKIQFGGGNIDVSSFQAMQEQLAANTSDMAQAYTDALGTSLTNLELMKPDLKKSEYEEMFKEIQDSYSKNMEGLNDRSVNFQLDFLAESYKDALDKVLPDMEGTTQEKLKTVIETALPRKPDVAAWETGDIKSWFGLDKINDETAGAVADILKNVAASVPQQQKEVWAEAFQDFVPDIAEIMKQVDFSKMAEAGVIPDTGEMSQKMVEQLVNDLVSKFESDPSFKGLQEFMEEYTTSALGSVDTEAADTAADVGKAIGEGIANGTKSTIESSSAEVKTAMENCINSAAATPFTPTISIIPNYTIQQPGSLLPNVSALLDTSASTQKIGRHAAGGFAYGKQLSWLAEEGYPEVVIPLNPSRRNRARELYKQAGEALGVAKHAAGGFVGLPPGSDVISLYTGNNEENLNYINGIAKNAPLSCNEAAGTSDRWGQLDTADNTDSGSIMANPVPAGTAAGSNAGAVNVDVNVNLSPCFNISGPSSQSGEDILALIRSGLQQLADEIGGEIAARLEGVFSNMPIEEEG